MSREQAVAAKNRGNEAFTKGDFETAIKEFSDAIKLDPTDHVFYSNRSGAYCSLQIYELALEDAEKCISVKPEFIKGYSRKGAALFGLGRIDDAKDAYLAGLKHDPANQALKEGLMECENVFGNPSDIPQAGPNNPLSKLFGPEMWGRLMMNPQTKPYLDDPAFVAKLKQIEKNPALFETYSRVDNRLLQCIGALLNLTTDFNQANKTPEQREAEDAKRQADAHKAEERKKQQEEAIIAAQKAKEEEARKRKEAELTPEQREAEEKKRQAAAVKEKGNDAYKKKDFEQAIKLYSEALELDPHSTVLRNNIAAVHFETKDYDQCVQKCKEAIENAQTHGGDYRDIAKAWNRMGNAYNSLKQYDDAIKAYHKSLLENNDDKVRQQLKKVEQIKKKNDEEAYLDSAKSEEHKTQGNELFNAGKYIDALEQYSEALRRDPSNYKVYSNRAACYSKLMDWQRALEDCDKCLSFDSKFVKAYIRKAKVQHFLKQYHKALEVWDAAKELDPTNQEVIEGRVQTLMAIQTNQGDPERARQSMQDPEIQGIMRDPTIQKVLSEMSSNPETAGAALKDPDIRKKIERLIAAGVVQVGH